MFAWYTWWPVGKPVQAAVAVAASCRWGGERGREDQGHTCCYRCCYCAMPTLSHCSPSTPLSLATLPGWAPDADATCLHLCTTHTTCQLDKFARYDAISLDGIEHVLKEKDKTICTWMAHKGNSTFHELFSGLLPIFMIDLSVIRYINIPKSM